MNKNTSVSMAAAIAVAGILTLAVLAGAMSHQVFAGSSNPCCDNDHNKCCDNDHNKCCDNDNKQPSKEVATGGNGGSGGAGGAGGEGGQGGANTVNSTSMKGSYQDTSLVMGSGNSNSNQTANGGDANGGHGGNANGGNAST